jgi:NAD(P)-dependent dehydrogenase (short-subunit alcohol dehydrogenase family)
MSGPLNGRSAVVTGGGRGIGAAISRALAADGARVMVASRTRDEVEAVAADLCAHGAEAFATVCDVADEASVEALVGEAHIRLGTVDILVNNAGDAGSAPLAKITLAEWSRMLAVNATGTFLCTRAFAPAMKEQGWGRIVNVASVAGLAGGRYISHYAAAKHAVIGFTESVGRELAKTGVTVNAVCPAYVDTPLNDRTVENVMTRTGRSRADALHAVLTSAGQDRLTTPEEVADAVRNLCRDSSGLTGAAVLVPPASASFEIVNPPELGEPRGWNNGLIAPRGSRILFVAGQTGVAAPGDANQDNGFVAQFGRALDRALAVVRGAGAGPEQLARLTVFVTDVATYRAERKALGAAWRERMGRHYPAMALVEVTGLVDDGAMVEIEATAILPGV